MISQLGIVQGYPPGNDISPPKVCLKFEDDFPFPKVGYVSCFRGYS